VILAPAATIRVRELPPELSPKSRPRAATDSLDLQGHARVMNERALERYRGNRRQAAQALKISTVTL
jgi:hypothetical protein